jgi:hypothetical protein
MAYSAEISHQFIATWKRARNMLATEIFAIAVLSMTICLVSYVLCLIAFHPLRRVPGPWLAKFSSSWQNYHAARLQKAHAVQSEILSTHIV